MDEQERQALLEMTETIGWRLLVREAKKELEFMKDAAINCKTIDDLCFIKGRSHEMAYLINFDQVLESLEETEDGEEEFNADLPV